LLNIYVRHSSFIHNHPVTDTYIRYIAHLITLAAWLFTQQQAGSLEWP